MESLRLIAAAAALYVAIWALGVAQDLSKAMALVRKERLLLLSDPPQLFASRCHGEGGAAAYPVGPRLYCERIFEWRIEGAWQATCPAGATYRQRAPRYYRIDLKCSLKLLGNLGFDLPKLAITVLK